jgi:hypothetical protein
MTVNKIRCVCFWMILGLPLLSLSSGRSLVMNPACDAAVTACINDPTVLSGATRLVHAPNPALVGGPLLDTDLLRVSIRRLAIRKVSSTVNWFLSKEEGTVKIGVGPDNKQTTLYWSGKTKGGILRQAGLSFDYDNALFAVPIAGLSRLPLSVSIVKNEDWRNERWKKAADAIDAVGKATADIPTAGGIISAASGLASAIARFVGNFKSTTELLYAGSFFENPAGRGEPFHLTTPADSTYLESVLGYYSLVKKGRGDSDIRLDFQVERLPTIANPTVFRMLPALAPGEVFGVKVLLTGFRILETAAGQVAGTIAKRVAKNNDGLVTVEFNIGGQSLKYDIYPNIFKLGVLDITGQEVYKGPWMASGIPASVSFTYTEKGKDFKSLVTATGALTTAAVPAAVGAGPLAGINVGQTLASSVLASIAPSETGTLSSVGSAFITASPQDISLLVYSSKGGRNLGRIVVNTALAPYVVPAPAP